MHTYIHIVLMLSQFKSVQSHPTLCEPMDSSRPGSTVHGIFQARILQWIEMSSSRGSSWLMDWTPVSCLFHGQAGSWALAITWEAYICIYIYIYIYIWLLVFSSSVVSWLFWNSMKWNPPVSSVHGMSHAKILERVAISFSRASSQPRDQSHCLIMHWQVISLPLSHCRRPYISFRFIEKINGYRTSKNSGWQRQLNVKKQTKKKTLILTTYNLLAQIWQPSLSRYYFETLGKAEHS